jgi:hypothetical protein
MTTAERLPDGRIWIVREDTSSLFLTPAEAEAVVQANQGRRATVHPGRSASERHLAAHRALGIEVAAKFEGDGA